MDAVDGFPVEVVGGEAAGEEEGGDGGGVEVEFGDGRALAAGGEVADDGVDLFAHVLRGVVDVGAEDELDEGVAGVLEAG